MFIETGSLVFFSLIIMFFWFKMSTRLWLFGHPVVIEIPFAIFAYSLHYGTFSGMMAAGVAAAMCFCFMRAGRMLVGYINKTGYHPGVFTVQL
jgi:hypothetical protein